MTAALLGSWELIENSGLTSRIQPATIAWADTSNPSAVARQRALSGEQHYKVDIGGSIVANLRRETGTFEGCFITAPDGTTMPLSETTDYPGIAWTSRSNSVNICNVQLGPIDADMVGTWMMRGWFIHNGLLIEAQQPVVVHEEDGIEHLPALEYLTHTGQTYDISLNRTVNLATCILIDPAGSEHTLSTASTIPGVAVYNADQYVICRVRIGPMEQSLIGEWTLVQQNTDGTKRRQNAVFQWANPSNPDEESWFVINDVPSRRQNIAPYSTMDEHRSHSRYKLEPNWSGIHLPTPDPAHSDRDARQLIIAPELTLPTDLEGTVEAGVSREMGTFEGCFLTIPDGTVIPIMYNTFYPGIKLGQPSRIMSCTVEIGPVTAK
ncbi:uncharacterized protein LOC125233248 [Leguminivora glycinivorella]|uniref:uncharacterized protein LOC125233248 n=1 Tax=Leguminivora glycinivorella TaxID=1035111 RepID=UPI00200C60B4|nr:uncharacterized protein LOC125233248 [Leguminivora glycinivorella]